jgi:hypothetical protein
MLLRVYSGKPPEYNPEYHFQLSPALTEACKGFLESLEDEDVVMESLNAEEGSFEGGDTDILEKGPDDEDWNDPNIIDQEFSEYTDVQDEEDEVSPVDFQNVTSAPSATVRAQLPLRRLLVILYTEAPTNANWGSFISPIVRFLILSSLKADGTWIPSSQITQTIAGLIFTGRLSIFSEILDIMAQNPDQHPQMYEFWALYLEMLLTQACRACDAVASHFEESRQAVLPSLYLLHRGIDCLQSADDHVHLFNAPDCSGRSIIIGSSILHLDYFGQTQLQLVKDITAEMDTLLFDCPIFKIGPNEHIHDEPRVRKAGYGFASDTRNSWMSKKTVLQHIVDMPELFQRFAYINHKGGVSWLPGPCNQFMNNIYNLQMKLAVATVITSGQTHRGTEPTALVYQNVSGGNMRNVLHLFDMFVLRGSYNKTSWASGKDRSMIRVPLPAVGHLWIRFLAFLRPLFLEWQYIFRPHLYHNAKHFLVAGLHRPVNTKDISQALSRWTEAHLGIKISLGLLRHVMTYVTATHSELFASVSSDVSGAAEQAGHTQAVEEFHYAIDSRLPETLSMNAFLRTARVSGIMHYIFGHPLDILKRLEVGTGRKRSMLQEIRNITHPLEQVSPVSSFTPNPQCLTDMMEHLLRTNVTPEIVQHVNRSVAAGIASAAHMFSPGQVFPRRPGPAPQIERLTAPYLLQLLRELFKRPNSDMGFKNANQAAMTQNMFEGTSHFVYVSATGM